MGPMGPMMGGWGNFGVSWVGFLPLLFILGLGLIALALWSANGATISRRPRSPEEILRERYARGEITQQQYRDALVDILKDRYIRGELELDEYETRLDLLLREPLIKGRQEIGGRR